MVYKKYHLRGGKRVGPYYYESYRDSSGKVKRRYLGTTNPYEKSSDGVLNKKMFSTQIFQEISFLLYLFLEHWLLVL